MLRRSLVTVLCSFVALAYAPLVAGCTAETTEEAATSESRLSEGDAVVNVDVLNLRAGPSTNDAILAEMQKGERVRVKGPTVSGFAPVTYGATTGWAWAEYLTSVGPRTIGSLDDAVASLARETSSRSPGTELGLAVMNLSTGEYAGAGDDVLHVTASSAKVIWVAAAMHAGANVADIAPSIFRVSDNELAGVAIDRAGGCDAVNAFMRNVVGMEHSLLVGWMGGRRASEWGELGGDNYFTARDLMLFLSKLDRGELLGERTEELRRYMKLAPDTGFCAWIPALLPAAVRPDVMHKCGSLPPPTYAEYGTMNDVGIVQVPGGERYAVAILARKGADYYGAQARLVERASCVVYRTIAHDATLPCND